MARKAKLVTEEQFKNLFIQYVSKMSDESLQDYFDSESLTEIKNGNIFNAIATLCMDSSLGKVYDDWSKIDFDLENFYADPRDSTEDWHLGFQQLNNGFTYVGVVAGGDWEFPVYAIIYHDGTTFRGYIPTKGNTYNTVTKSAFGSESNFETDTETEFDLIKKGLAVKGADVSNATESNIYELYEQYLVFDYVSIKNDIEERIALDGEYKKPIDVSKMDKVIEKVIELEKAEESSQVTDDKVTEEIDLGNGKKVVLVYGKSHIPHDDPFEEAPKSEYHEVISVYEYKHMVDIAKEMLKENMSLSDFINIAETSDNVEDLVSAAKRLIMNKRVSEAARKLFGDDE